MAQKATSMICSASPLAWAFAFGSEVRTVGTLPSFCLLLRTYRVYVPLDETACREHPVLHAVRIMEYGVWSSPWVSGNLSHCPRVYRCSDRYVLTTYLISSPHLDRSTHLYYLLPSHLDRDIQELPITTTSTTLHPLPPHNPYRSLIMPIYIAKHLNTHSSHSPHNEETT